MVFKSQRAHVSWVALGCLSPGFRKPALPQGAPSLFAFVNTRPTKQQGVDQCSLHSLLVSCSGWAAFMLSIFFFLMSFLFLMVAGRISQIWIGYHKAHPMAPRCHSVAPSLALTVLGLQVWSRKPLAPSRLDMAIRAHQIRLLEQRLNY